MLVVALKCAARKLSNKLRLWIWTMPATRRLIYGDSYEMDAISSMGLPLGGSPIMQR